MEVLAGEDAIGLKSTTTTASGKKGDASPPFLKISLTMVEATLVYFGSPVRKMVSIFESIVLLASAMVFSYSKSLTYRIPLKINFAPID
ncbi:MAG: hypothetical protein RLZZ176_1195 [Cyanobacteriota bacterium]